METIEQQKQEIIKKLKFLFSFEMISAFKKLDSNFKDDIDIVKIAVASHPDILEYVSDRLKDNEQFLFEPICSMPSSFKWVSDRLKKDKTFILSILSELNKPYYRILTEEYAFFFEQIPKTIIDKEFAYHLIKANSNSITYLDHSFYDIKSFHLLASNNNKNFNPKYFQNAPKHIKNDIELVTDLMNNNADYYPYLNTTFNKNEHFALLYLKKNLTNLNAKVYSKIPPVLRNSLSFSVEAFDVLNRDTTYFPEPIKVIFRKNSIEQIKQLANNEKAEKAALLEQKENDKKFLSKIKKITVNQNLFKRNLLKDHM
jgi:hypothetical protein